MEIEVLLSCMHQTDTSIITRSHLQYVPTLVINQCKIEKEKNKIINSYLRWIDTPSRGLSISRNLAISNSTSDICIIADDDEIFEDNVLSYVQNAYTQFPQADVIIFSHPIHGNHKLGSKARKLGKYDLLRVSSRQITFRRQSVYPTILFDTNLGAGTNNGAGEENKFLFDCYNAKLRIYFVPQKLATHYHQPSTWFFGYNKQFFYNRGKSTRYIWGFWFACVYGLYFLIAKRKKYIHNISQLQAAKALFLGIWKNEIKRYD